VVSVGIRSIAEEEKYFLKSSSVKAFFAKDIQEGDDWMDDVIRCLGKDVYVTFDLDSLDPSIMPAVGTPQPGGLLWYPTLELLRKVSAARNVVGFDVVELMPLPANPAADVTAAKLVFKMIGYFFSRK
jgi:agmatinase